MVYNQNVASIDKLKTENSRRPSVHQSQFGDLSNTSPNVTEVDPTTNNF